MIISDIIRLRLEIVYTLKAYLGFESPSLRQKAANQPDKDFFFIIDEINRGNMSKIFGELLMLIERDYRGTKTTLAYNGLTFTVPKNIYIIGMMNTADRSLAMIPKALCNIKMGWKTKLLMNL